MMTTEGRVSAMKTPLMKMLYFVFVNILSLESVICKCLIGKRLTLHDSYITRLYYVFSCYCLNLKRKKGFSLHQ